MGFEPTETCASHAFQACRFGRSRTPPRLRTAYLCGYRRLPPTTRCLLSDIVTSRFRRVRWRSGPVQRTPENQVRVGRQQPSSETFECRRPPGRHFSRRSRILKPSAPWIARSHCFGIKHFHNKFGKIRIGSTVRFLKMLFKKMANRNFTHQIPAIEKLIDDRIDLYIRNQPRKPYPVQNCSPKVHP